MQNINNYFNIYSLDYTHLNDFREALTHLEGQLKDEFQNACDGTFLKKDIETLNSQLKFLKLIPTNKLNDQLITTLENCCQNNVTLLKDYQGSDPIAINMLVHTIMGIWNDNNQIYLEGIRQNYFDLMKKTGFLRSEFDHVNGEKSQPISPDLKNLTKDYLLSHPEVNSLTLACGKAGNRGLGSCHSRREEEHSNKTLTIDLNPGQGPDIVTNFHDDKLWEAIPDDRFDAIYDHSNGWFLFDDSQHSSKTISEIFRVLKPEGYLKMDFFFNEKHIVQLKQVGFVIESEISKIAKKPKISTNKEENPILQ